MEKVQGDFLMTYDNNSEIHRMAAQHGFDTKEIAMKNTHHAKMTELVIGRDLNWII
jgi:DNA adenine methylase